MSTLNKSALTGPRKLLALDGGGIRGTITLEILAKLESSLQEKLQAGPGFVLADYFDYVAGTSTGAIIATCLSLGMRVADVRQFYLESGPAMFDKASLLKRFRTKYNDTQLAQKLRAVIGQQTGESDAKLGSQALKTYLLLILRNASTDSPWPLSNNPRAKYNDITRHNCNLELPLWQLVRASTAAPTYFPPEVVSVGGEEYVFVDGGVTMYNNPAFQLFLMATLKPYKLEWPTGPEQLLLVSVGTGAAANANAHLAPDEMNLLYNAGSIPSALMYAASTEQDMLCRVFGRCLHGGEIDSEVMDLKGDIGPGSLPGKLFTYLRYNVDLSRQGLDALGLPHIAPEAVQQMDSVKYIAELQQVGQAVARDVDMAHFAGFVPA